LCDLYPGWRSLPLADPGLLYGIPSECFITIEIEGLFSAIYLFTSIADRPALNHPPRQDI
jgi:hypothetical protein